MKFSLANLKVRVDGIKGVVRRQSDNHVISTFYKREHCLTWTDKTCVPVNLQGEIALYLSAC